MLHFPIYVMLSLFTHPMVGLHILGGGENKQEYLLMKGARDFRKPVNADVQYFIEDQGWNQNAKCLTANKA